MPHTLKINGLEVTGAYWPRRENFEHGQPRTTPPEPARFDIDLVYDEDGYQVILTPAELDEIEREAIRQIRDEG